MSATCTAVVMMVYDTFYYETAAGMPAGEITDDIFCLESAARMTAGGVLTVRMAATSRDTISLARAGSCFLLRANSVPRSAVRTINDAH